MSKNDKLDLTLHVEKTTCYALIGLIKKVDKNRKRPDTVILLYNGLVRSIVEYGQTVWDMHLVTITKEIESIQKQIVLFALRKTEKRDENYALIPYNERCAKLNLQSLERRRRINNEIFSIHDVIFDRINSPFLKNRIEFNSNHYSVRNNRPLIIKGKINHNFQFGDPLRIAIESFNNIFHKLRTNILQDRSGFRNLV